MPPTWIVGVSTLVTCLAAVAVVYGWRWGLSRRKERLPIAEKILRPPGESLRRKLAELDEAESEALFLTIITPVFLSTALMVPPAGSGKLTVALVLLLMAGTFAFNMRRLMKIAIERRQYRLGFFGERAVGEILNELMLEGCRVFHDVPMEPYGNIDHVVVAESGVWAVETKTRRKKEVVGKKDYEIVYDGQTLHFPHCQDAHGLEQARRQGEQLRAWLTKAVGEPVPVRAILTFPGWFVTTRAKSELKVLSPKMIRHAVLDGREPRLSATMRQRVAHQLDGKCRDVEL